MTNTFLKLKITKDAKVQECIEFVEKLKEASTLFSGAEFLMEFTDKPIQAGAPAQGVH